MTEKPIPKQIFKTGLGWSMEGSIGSLVKWWLAGKITSSEQKNLQVIGAPHSHLGDFIIVLLLLYAKVMRARDGKAHPIATDRLPDYLEQTFSREQAEEMIDTLADFQERDFKLDSVLAQVHIHMPLQERVQLVCLLFGMVLISPSPYKYKEVSVHEIAYTLGISERVFHSMRGMLRHENNIVTLDNRRVLKGEDGDMLNEAYAILGAQKSTRTHEIKLAYRELMNAYDAKKLSYLEERFWRNAENRSQKITFAYKELRRARSF